MNDHEVIEEAIRIASLQPKTTDVAAARRISWGILGGTTRLAMSIEVLASAIEASAGRISDTIYDVSNVSDR